MGGQYACPNRHSFDISREGYVNLLLVQQKKTKEPGDSKEMMVNRKAFLERGCYDRFFDELIEVTVQELSGRKAIKEICHLIDVGCGEGSFLSRLEKHLPVAAPIPQAMWGLDISKAGIRIAAQRNPRVHWGVASTFKLPLITGSVDVIFQIFAPAEPKEFARALKPSGLLIVVTPGPRHLFGLKKLIYEDPQTQEKDLSPAGYSVVRQKKVSYLLSLRSSTEIMSLLGMTPFYWNINLATRERIERESLLETDLEFLITVYKAA